MSPESTGGPIINRKRFNLLVIMWYYLRRIDIVAYNQLDIYYKVEVKLIRRFERYYELYLNVKS